MRDALLWSLPGLLVGIVVHAAFLRVTPFAYWSQDSGSFQSFAYELFERGEWSMNAKRRWIYPIFLAACHLLPGAVLAWISLLQHAFSVTTVWAGAYIIRKIFVTWRLWIVPATLLLALNPYLLYYSGHVLPESLFSSLLLWAAAGWAAWAGGDRGIARPQRFWFFFAPLVFWMLMKPSARFFWPGLLVAFAALGLWRSLRWTQAAALVALLALTSTLGKGSQGARLLLASTFPMVRLDSPVHAEYKAELAAKVREARAQLDTYYDADGWVKHLLQDLDEMPELPAWHRIASEGHGREREKLYMGLAREAVLSEPLCYMYVVVQRVVMSHLALLKDDRWYPSYRAQRLAAPYWYREQSSARPGLLHKQFGIARHAPLPAMDVLAARMDPHPGSSLPGRLVLWAERSRTMFAWFMPADAADRGISFRDVRPSVIGLLGMAGFFCAFLPRYRMPMGAFLLGLAVYIVGVFAVGSVSERYYMPVAPWAWFLPALSCDFALCWLRRRFWRPGGKDPVPEG